MATGRDQTRFREHARGVGLVVLLGAGVCLAGVAVIALFVWLMT